MREGGAPLFQRPLLASCGLARFAAQVSGLEVQELLALFKFGVWSFGFGGYLFRIYSFVATTVASCTCT